MKRVAIISTVLFGSALFGGVITQTYSASASTPPGQRGYEGQPGNQGGGGGSNNGLSGYEGQPGNQGG